MSAVIVICHAWCHASELFVGGAECKQVDRSRPDLPYVLDANGKTVQEKFAYTRWIISYYLIAYYRIACYVIAYYSMLMLYYIII